MVSLIRRLLRENEELRNGHMSAVVLTPKNTMPRIDSIWAYLSVDPDDGNEGVLSAPLLGPGSQVPLIAADEARLKSIGPIAEKIAQATGRRVRLVKFATREVVREFGGQ
jgi:hypothetical protein